MRAIKITKRNETRIRNEVGPNPIDHPLYKTDDDRNYYIVASRNDRRLEYPYMIWGESLFRKYYAFTEKEDPNKFVPVRRIK